MVKEFLLITKELVGDGLIGKREINHQTLKIHFSKRWLSVFIINQLIIQTYFLKIHLRLLLNI